MNIVEEIVTTTYKALDGTHYYSKQEAEEQSFAHVFRQAMESHWPVLTFGRKLRGVPGFAERFQQLLEEPEVRLKMEKVTGEVAEIRGKEELRKKLVDIYSTFEWSKDQEAVARDIGTVLYQQGYKLVKDTQND